MGLEQDPNKTNQTGSKQKKIDLKLSLCPKKGFGHQATMLKSPGPVLTFFIHRL